MRPTTGALTGTGTLVRLMVRRDRALLTGWIVLLVLIGLGTVAYYLGLFATEEARQAFAQDVASTPALRAFNGELYGTGIGVMSTWRMRDLSYTLVAIMAVLTVIRHTRAEEESGRQELIGAAVVGRHAPVTAALIVATTAAGAVAALNGIGMVALGLEPVGSLAHAVTAATTGAVFTALGALAAQIAGTARGAIAVAVLVLGTAYLVRFVADGSGLGALRWFTPLGWAHLTRPFADEAWAVSLLTVLLTLTIVGVSYAILARRDFGTGLLPTRRGPARGRLGTPLALAWRLHRGLLAGWMSGFAVAGLFFGGLAAGTSGTSGAVADSVALQEFVRRYTGDATATMDDAFLWVIALTLGYTAALYPALAVLRLRSEESSGRADALLAGPVDRLRWAGGHVLVATLGTVAVLATAGLTAGLAFGVATDDVPGQLPRILAGTLVQIPAAWMLGAVTMLAFGVLPRIATAVAWAGFLFIQVFELLGPIMGIDFRYIEVLIPFWHLPRILAGGRFTALPLITLTVLGAALVLAGMAALHRRDLAQAG